MPQVLALVFIRKLMDCVFSKREMSWLDDLMPESKKKKLEDAEEVLYLFTTTCMSISMYFMIFLMHVFNLIIPSGGRAEYTGRR